MEMKKYSAEALGACMLTFIGAGAAMANAFSGGMVGVAGIALAFGFAAFAAVYTLGAISGAHINPAVTVGFFIVKKITAPEAARYIISQLVGATAAGLLLSWTFGSLTPMSNAVTTLRYMLTPMQGVLIEALLTFFLMSVVLAFSKERNTKAIHAGAAIAMVIAMDILAGGIFTGASMNPARTFGPAIVAGVWKNHWVYWVGPILGAAAAAWLSPFLSHKSRTKS